MRGLAVARARNKRLRYLFVSLAASFLGVAYVQVSPVAAQSVIGATVCAASSTITIDAPESDSVVTSPIVQLSGNVTQASQIEVEIDNEFNDSIQLNIGQTSYTGSVQLSAGTHTIKVTAVSVCPSANGTASVIVTYEAPPQSPSTGSQTSTTIADTQAGSINNSNQSQGGLGLLGTVLQPLQGLARWLNIDLGDAGHHEVAAMPIARAVVFTAGLYVLIIGLAPSVIQTMASFSFIAGMLPHAPVPVRIRMVAAASRGVGLLLVLGSLFIP